MRNLLDSQSCSGSVPRMFDSKHLFLAPILLLSFACATSSAGSTPAAGGTGSAAAAGTNGTPATASQTKVVCEWVRPSGSNIAQEQCREVRSGDDPSKTTNRNYFMPQQGSLPGAASGR